MGVERSSQQVGESPYRVLPAREALFAGYDFRFYAPSGRASARN